MVLVVTDGFFHFGRSMLSQGSYSIPIAGHSFYWMHIFKDCNPCCIISVTYQQVIFLSTQKPPDSLLAPHQRISNIFSTWPRLSTSLILLRFAPQPSHTFQAIRTLLMGFRKEAESIYNPSRIGFRSMYSSSGSALCLYLANSYCCETSTCPRSLPH